MQTSLIHNSIMSQLSHTIPATPLTQPNTSMPSSYSISPIPNNLHHHTGQHPYSPPLAPHGPITTPLPSTAPTLPPLTPTSTTSSNTYTHATPLSVHGAPNLHTTATKCTHYHHPIPPYTTTPILPHHTLSHVTPKYVSATFKLCFSYVSVMFRFSQIGDVEA